MTSLARIEPAATPPRADQPASKHLTLELTEMLKLAVPIALTQLGQIAMMTTDLALIGRLGDSAVADGIQTVVAGALRGLNDTRVPLLFAAISYWLVGFPAACSLAFWTALGAVGVWIGLSCGTAVYAVLLILRFRLLARRLQLVDFQ
jgi:Na+-driven multidrug efflux pump